MKVEFLPLAAQELVEAAAEYEQHVQALGLEFARKSSGSREFSNSVTRSDRSSIRSTAGLRYVVFPLHSSIVLMRRWYASLPLRTTGAGRTTGDREFKSVD